METAAKRRQSRRSWRWLFRLPMKTSAAELRLAGDDAVGVARRHLWA